MDVIAKISFETLLNLTGTDISLVKSVGVSALTYGILIYFMRIKEVDTLVNSFKNKISKIKNNYKGT